MEIKKIIDEIIETQGTNAKIDKIQENIGNELFKKILYLTYSRRIKFYLKQIPGYSSNKTEGFLSLETALYGLDELTSRRLTGHAGIAHLKSILEAVHPDDALVIEKIINKDLKLGTATTSINKAYPGLIEKEPYQGAIPYNEADIKEIFDTVGYAIADIKEDGRYSNAMVRGGEVDALTSRQGETTNILTAAFCKDLAKLGDGVYTGELIIPGIDRYKSNGLISALVSIGKKQLEGKNVEKELSKFYKEHGKTTQEVLDSIHFRVWHRLTIDEFFAKRSTQALRHNREQLVKDIEESGVTNVGVVKWKFVESIEEAREYFIQALENGEEGIIIKNPIGGWQDGKRKNQIKFKLEMNVDLKVIQFNYGTRGTKNENVISAMVCVSSCGKVKSVPTGIKEEDMQYIADNQNNLLGSIVEVKSCGLTYRDGMYALLHPVFIKFRDDKNTYDSLESIQAIENMVKGLTA